MSTAIATAEKKTTKAAATPRPISKEEFLRDYSGREDGFKYEWNKGQIEKTDAMNQEQTTIFLLLSRIFCKTKAFKEGGGLTAETDVDTSTEQMRRPDISFFSGEQIEQMKKGEKVVPKWLAEVISKNDKADLIIEKLKEYFMAGVKNVWHIYPASKQVHVYTSPEDVTICMGKTICSAAPA
ncbi:MAG TPA: Uma2 family endonuclease, partial [Bacteroidetes bacterium]|nr:Uma2 family endonuclease [Bacteroidota bacterium]